jgi:serine/threonine protein kinase
MPDPGARAAETPAPSPRRPAGGADERRDLGPYRIEALLGRGGMSSVYRALQTTLDRPVALKLLPPEFAGDPTFVARFLQEARAAAALQHPHIIPIYDSGQYDGRYYIAMRYVDGVPLARAIPENGLSVPRALRIIEQIASALDYAHARGVVHRDVSAGNVMLEAGDRVTLMDFGIAQARQGSRLTRAGVAVGTLEYLSPEQARGEAATAQSDIYSLGVLAFELLSGKLPFTAADDRGLLLQHLNAPLPSIRQLRPDIPAGIDSAIQRCLAKDPAARFPSAAAFVAALNGALAESRRRTAVIVPPLAKPAVVAPPVRTTAPPAKPGPAKAAPPSRPNPTGPARGRLTHRHRLPRWAPLLLLLLLPAIAGGVYAERQVQTGAPGRAIGAVERTLSAHAPPPPAATSAGHRAGATSQPTATPPPATASPTAAPVHAALPEDAVQGFYSTLNPALQKGHEAAAMAAAYAYLSPSAQFQLPFADFQRQYAADTSLSWRWYPPTYTADKQNASIHVDLTEYRQGGNAVSHFDWVVVTSGSSGWRLDHVVAQVDTPTTNAPADEGAAGQGAAGRAGNGHGKGHKG